MMSADIWFLYKFKDLSSGNPCRILCVQWGTEQANVRTMEKNHSTIPEKVKICFRVPHRENREAGFFSG